MTPSHALLTRPRPQLDELERRVGALGLVAVGVPAFSFEAAGERIRPDAAWRDASRRLLLFTSPRAVDFGLGALAPGMVESATVAAIGPATRHALAERGIDALVAPGDTFHSEALLAHLEHAVQPGSAVILAAPGGREALERGLAGLGWDVRLAPVYHRVFLSPDPEAVARLHEADGLVSVWTSASALDHLLMNLPGTVCAKLREGVAIVVSSRLAKVAREHGISDVRQAAGPDNDALVDACAALLAEARPGTSVQSPP